MMKKLSSNKMAGNPVFDKHRNVNNGRGLCYCWIATDFSYSYSENPKNSGVFHIIVIVIVISDFLDISSSMGFRT